MAVLLVVALYLLLIKQVGWICLILSLFFLAAGFYYTKAWRQIRTISHSYSTQQELIGTIVEPPDIRADSEFLTVQLQKDQGKILVKAARYPVWHYGDTIRLKGSLEEPASFSGFNYPLYLERFGIFATMPRPRAIKLVAKDQANRLLGSLFGLRTYWEGVIQDALPEPESSFLAGILLGSKRAIPQNIQDQLKQTGTSHIIAISGANITIVLGLLLQVLPLYTPRSKLTSTIAIAVFITLLTGASASVLRGSLVACLGSYLRARSRRAWTTAFILSSMVLLLLGNPLLLVADPGFQLSYAAFAGLAYIGSPIKQGLEKFQISERLPEIIKSSFAETAAATFGTAPLSLGLFGQLSLIGLIVNPLILWLLPLTTLLGLVVLGSAWLVPSGAILRLPLWALLHAILGVIGIFSRLHFGVIHLTLAHE